MRRKLEAASRDRGAAVVAALFAGFGLEFVFAGFAFGFDFLERVTGLRGSTATAAAGTSMSIDDASLAFAAVTTDDRVGATASAEPEFSGTFLLRPFFFFVFAAVLFTGVLVLVLFAVVVALWSRHVAAICIGGRSTAAAATATRAFAASKSIAMDDDSSGVTAVADVCFFFRLFRFLVFFEDSAESATLDFDFCLG
jgi:hypothetical protein